MARTKGRISIPQNINKKFDIADKVVAKHNADGNSSPLNQLTTCDWSKIIPAVEAAKNWHKQAEDFKKKMENAYRERDLLMPIINDMLKHSRNYLKGLFPDNPKRLGGWGFEVDDTPPSARKHKAK